MKFKPGDRVEIIKPSLMLFGHTGTVQKYGSAEIVDVLMDYPNPCWDDIYFVKESSLALIENGKENETMNNTANIIPGNYEVAICTFHDSSNPEKQYAYALFDFCATIGDLALVHSGNNYGVVRIENILSMNEHEAGGGHPVTNEIICKVDFSGVQRRVEQRRRKEELRKQMDKLVKENQELILLQVSVRRYHHGHRK